MSKAKRTRIATLLNQAEVKQFRVVEKFVRAYCGKVSRAEVLRYLIRNWSKWNS